MSLLIEAVGPDRLADYASVPSVLGVESKLVVDEIDHGSWRFELREQPIPAPYSKDYDSYGEGGPLAWRERFDVSKWRLWLATHSGDTIGGAAIASNIPGPNEQEASSDSVILWDIRVRAAHRRQGVGTALFREAARWAKANGYRSLAIETQNVNISACRFYAKMGCVLSRIERFAYRDRPEIADEIMLVWELNLGQINRDGP